MLIDFSVSNYRSIKETVTLSAIERLRPVVNGTSKSSLAPAYSIESRGIAVLPVLGIFGANASGKSNVVRSMNYFLLLLKMGAGEDGIGLKQFTPFKLDPVQSLEPTCFHVRVGLEGIIFSYVLHLNQQQVLLERLEYLPPYPKRNRLLFSRQWQGEKYIWKNGEDFKGPHTQLQKGIKPYQPFFSLISEQLEVEVSKPLSEWIKSRPYGLSLGTEDFDAGATAYFAHKFPSLYEQINQFLKAFDTSVAGFTVIERKGAELHDWEQRYRVMVYHDSPEGRVSWPLSEESTGTQRLFGLSRKILDCLQYGGLLIVDELGANIHPNITRKIVRLFQNPKTNPRRAQLLFTSHDNTLKRGQLLRRDEIWFTEKKADGSTKLFPLTDFSVRQDLAVDKAYLEGRFGAVPVLSPDEDVLKLIDIKPGS